MKRYEVVTVDTTDVERLLNEHYIGHDIIGLYPQPGMRMMVVTDAGKPSDYKLEKAKAKAFKKIDEAAVLKADDEPIAESKVKEKPTSRKRRGRK